MCVCVCVEKSPFIKVHRVTDPFFFSFFMISVFNFSQTVEMDFVSFEVEKMRMFLVQSVNSSLVRVWLGLSHCSRGVQLEYASSVWDPYSQENIAKIEAVQRRAARRFILNRFRNTSSVNRTCWRRWDGLRWSNDARLVDC